MSEVAADRVKKIKEKWSYESLIHVQITKGKTTSLKL